MKKTTVKPEPDQAGGSSTGLTGEVLRDQIQGL